MSYQYFYWVYRPPKIVWPQAQNHGNPECDQRAAKRRAFRRILNPVAVSRRCRSRRHVSVAVITLSLGWAYCIVSVPATTFPQVFRRRPAVTTTRRTGRGPGGNDLNEVVGFAQSVLSAVCGSRVSLSTRPVDMALALLLMAVRRGAARDVRRNNRPAVHTLGI